MTDFEKMAREIFPDDSRTPYASKEKAELWLEFKRESIAAALRTAYAAGVEADRRTKENGCRTCGEIRHAEPTKHQRPSGDPS